jgi:UDPglucose 6-dehydrogenase
MQEIGIIGIGKLGLCFALNLDRKGFKVTGIDVSEEYINQINSKTLLSTEKDVSNYLKKANYFLASTKLEDVIKEKIKVIFVFVATPSLPDGSYNHTQIEKIAAELIAKGKRKEKIHLVIGCTTMPEYCNILAEKLNPYNYTISYNPEFIAQGSIIKDQQFPDSVLIGEESTVAGNKIQEIYEILCENTPIFNRMDRTSAEICKIATNCFLTTKISFANSIGDLALKAGADYTKILKAIGSDSRIGAKYLNYGFGFGGPCFPRDNRALGKYAQSKGYPLLISEATDKVNKQHLEFQFQYYLKNYSANETIVFDTVSYKKGSNILEESQQLALAVKLANNKRIVLIKDTKEVIEKVNRMFPNLFRLKELK